MTTFKQLADDPWPKCRVDNALAQAERVIKHIELERLLESMEEWWKSIGIEVLHSDTKKIRLKRRYV